jgi:pilus assembly protein CpaE
MPPTEPSVIFAWKPLVVCPHREMALRVRAALAEVGLTATQAVTEYPAIGEAEAIGLQQRSNICFLDVASNPDHALQLIAEVAGLMPVVALHPDKDADSILRCLRRGASEFLSDPSVDAVRGVLERVVRSRTPQPPPKQVGALLCVVPGKPGCGASTVAAHLALQLHAADNRKVLLVDADPMAGSIGFMLRLKSDYHLGDVVRDWQRMDDDLWARLRSRFAGIDVLVAPDFPVPRFDLGQAMAAELAGYWKLQYDAVVVDTPDLRTACESGFAAASDHLLLVTTNELAAVHVTRRGIEFLEQAPGYRERLRLVVNRYNAAMGLKRDDLRTVFQVEPFAVLSSDYELVQDAILNGKPVASRSKFQSSIQALSRQLAGEARAEKKPGSWLDLLHRRK